MTTDEIANRFEAIKGIKLAHLKNVAVVVALHTYGGNRTKSAKALGVTVKTLRNLIRKSPFVQKHFPRKSREKNK